MVESSYLLEVSESLMTRSRRDDGKEHIAWSFLSISKNEISFGHPNVNNAQDPLLPILGLLSPWNVSEAKQVEWVGMRGVLG